MARHSGSSLWQCNFIRRHGVPMSVYESCIQTPDVRIREGFAFLNSNQHFKKLADEGYIDLDEPRQTIFEDATMPDRLEYNRWIHEAWSDFINQMNRKKNRPTISLVDDSRAYCNAHLSGTYFGRIVCAKTHITFRYTNLEGLRYVYQWKVKLEPNLFSSTSGNATNCSCILKCCCINKNS